MNKKLSIIMASALLAAPMSMGVNAENADSECKLPEILKDYLSEHIDCIDGNCSFDTECNSENAFEKIMCYAERLKCALSGNCSDSENPIVPEFPEIPGTPETPETPDAETPELPEIPDTEEDTGAGSGSVNSEVMEVVELVNKYRAENGLPALSYDASVSQAALVRSKELPTLFSHTRPDGSSCFTALDELGISYRGAGENIAAGQTSASQVMNDWMNSSGHRANILNESFTKIGVGLYVDGSGRQYWTQLFTY